VISQSNIKLKVFERKTVRKISSSRRKALECVSRIRYSREFLDLNIGYEMYSFMGYDAVRSVENKSKFQMKNSPPSSV
jgi:hypothetical protein